MREGFRKQKYGRRKIGGGLEARLWKKDYRSGTIELWAL
jgi:hypothetical protein